MNKCLTLVHLIAITLLSFEPASAQTELPQARIANMAVEPGEALVLHLRPGYVSSVRVLEDISSVVLGDPGTFKAEHSEAEPQLVFFKATTAKPAHTNALITTKSGHEIAITLLSLGKVDRSEPVDYLLICRRARSFLIAPSPISFLIGETKSAVPNDRSPAQADPQPVSTEQALLKAERISNPHWHGKSLQVAVGQPIARMLETIVPFSVLNSTTSTLELLPPQIELAGTSKDKRAKGAKAERVAIKNYWLSTRQLVPGARADGAVLFERPSFKESREQLLLSVARADAVDRPVLVPLEFVAPIARGGQ